MRVCLATERVQQSHSAPAAALIPFSVPNMLLARTHPSPNCSLSTAMPRIWERLHIIEVELPILHRQRRLQSRPQAASLISTLLLCRGLLVSVVTLGTTSLVRAAARCKGEEKRVLDLVRR